VYVQTIGEYEIYTVGKYPGFSVKCTKGAYCNHAHKLPSVGMARQLIYWVEHKIIPNSVFYRESCRRLTTDEYYKERLINHKDKDGYYRARGR